MGLLKTVKILFGALKLSLYREKLTDSLLEVYLAKYNITSTMEWIPFLFMILFISFASTGVSVENPMVHNDITILNVYILSAFIFIAVIMFSLVIRRLIIPNISIMIDRIPIHPFKTFSYYSAAKLTIDCE